MAYPPKFTIRSYREAVEALKGRQSRALARGVKLEQASTTLIILRYYETPIIYYQADEKVYLVAPNRTQTIKRLFCRYSIASVWQSNYKWYWNNLDGNGVRPFENWVNVGSQSEIPAEKPCFVLTKKQAEAYEILKPIL